MSLSSLATSQSDSNVLETPNSFVRFPPLSPSEAESSFVAQNGFQMKLIASEPWVTDPVAMVYDENGRAYVVEMNDYPYTDKKAHAAFAENKADLPIGKVRLLEDTDDDGVFDKSSIFVEGLSWPSGIACSHGGVYITATPDVWYCKDHDGDGRADERRQVLTGFRKFNVQAIINNPIWGLDHRLYVAGSSNGGNIRSPKDMATKAWRGDFRIRTENESFEPISGGGRFGNTFDDWGNRFICNIRNPAIQIVLDYDMLARNPFYAGPKAMFDSAEASDQLPIFRISPVEPWRELRAQQWLNDSSKSKTPRSELSGGGVFTSASGITIYRGDQYGAAYYGQAFLGEVANNVIYRQSIERDGIVFQAKRADETVEFVASTDTWFRPVNFVNAPDGTLHVLDMYREYIEHPWSIPDDIHAMLDLENGRDRGRIYRLEPPKFKASPSPRLGTATDEELVSMLDHTNAWWRETAHRLLIERNSRASRFSLKRLWMTASTQGRIHLLWVLASLNELDESALLLAMSDPVSEVREQAIEIVTRLLRTASPIVSTSVSDALIRSSDDPDIRVRFRGAIAIGDLKTDAASDALVRIALRDASDPWMRAAILSSPPDLTYPIVKKYLSAFLNSSTKFPAATFSGEAMSILGAQGSPEVLSAVFQQVDTLEPFFRALNGTKLPSIDSNSKQATSLQKIGTSVSNPSGVEAVESMWTGLLTGLRRNGKSLREVFKDSNSSVTAIVAKKTVSAKGTLDDEESTESARILAFQWLGYESWDNAKATLLKVLDASPKPPVQAAAVQAISRYREPEVASALLSRWKSYTPTVREAVFSALLARKERILELLNAVADKKISISTIDASRKSQIMAFNDKEVQERSKELFQLSINHDRATVVEKYRRALEMQGDSGRGNQLYTKHCAACHRWKGQGVELGPNLETVQNWDGDRIILNMFDPHREVAGQYLSYSVLLKDGRTLTGTISDETATSISLKQKEVAPQTILLSEIEQIANSGISLMPNGLEEQLTLQDTADLLKALKTR